MITDVLIAIKTVQQSTASLEIRSTTIGIKRRTPSREVCILYEENVLYKFMQSDYVLV